MGRAALKFDDVGTAYTVGSIALALILFDGGLRTRFATFRNVLAPSVMLATVGVLITTLLTAPVAKLVLGIGWIQALLVGAVVASTDAAAVFFLINAARPAAAPARARHAGSGIRHQRSVRGVPRAAAGRDPAVGNQTWSHALLALAREADPRPASSASSAAGSSRWCSTG